MLGPSDGTCEDMQASKSQTTEKQTTTSNAPHKVHPQSEVPAFGQNKGDLQLGQPKVESSVPLFVQTSWSVD